MNTHQQYSLDLRAGHGADILIEALDKGGTLPEELRARIHALTRKVTMTDEECVNLMRQWADTTDDPKRTPTAPETWEQNRLAMLDLRDRYEERGKYAPAAAQETKA